MKSIEWKDVTMYVKRQKKRDATAWAATLGADPKGEHGMVVRLACDYTKHPGKWVLDAEPFFKQFVMGDLPLLEQFKTSALTLVQNRCYAVINTIEDAKGIV